MNFGRFVDPVLAALLMGTADENSPLYLLRGGLAKTVLPIIWAEVSRFYEGAISQGRRKIGASYCKYVRDLFPPPSGINVNMMPFRLGDVSSLPEYLLPFWKLIQACPVDASEKGAICYLTVHESKVTKDESQRRPGLHCESAGFMRVAKKTEIAHASIWGAGRIQNEHYFGGIYLASTVSDSCEIHNCTIEKPEVIGTHGSIEHLRKRVFEKCGNRFRPKMGELYWITDRTPHESLPLKAGTQRTFFRLVTSSVSHWYKDHSTPNPLVEIPPTVTIIEGDKFKM